MIRLTGFKSVMLLSPLYITGLRHLIRVFLWLAPEDFKTTLHSLATVVSLDDSWPVVNPGKSLGCMEKIMVNAVKFISREINTGLYTKTKEFVQNKRHFSGSLDAHHRFNCITGPPGIGNKTPSTTKSVASGRRQFLSGDHFLWLFIFQ